jgi:hypothetical protein
MEYELDIYASTPDIFWIFVITSLFSAFLLNIQYPTNPIKITTLVIFIANIILIVLLPILRGYYYYGRGDPLTHLGIARDISSGVVTPFDRIVLYPGIHLISAILKSITGMTIEHSILIIPAIFTICFFLSCTLLVKEIAAFSVVPIIVSGMLLPINHLGIHLKPHPASEAILFAPFIIYLSYMATKYANNNFNIVYYISIPVIVVIHPRQALAIIAVISGVYISHRLLDTTNSVKGLLSASISIIYSGVIFLLWIFSKKAPGDHISKLYVILTNLDRLGGSSRVDNAGSLLGLIGADIGLIFLKLFGVSTLLSILVGVKYLSSIVSSIKSNGYNKDWLIITSGIIPPLLLFLFYVVTSPGEYFRVLGLIMVLITISFSAIIVDRISVPEFKNRRTIFLSVCFILLLVSIPVLHPSPFIVKPTDHVTEKQAKGFDTTFKYMEENNIVTTRSSLFRFRDALLGTYTSRLGKGVSPVLAITEDYSIRDSDTYYYSRVPYNFGKPTLGEYYTNTTYLIVTEEARTRDLELYEGVRFSQGDFEYLNQDSDIEKTYSNGGYTLYTIKGSHS